ncbi:MAG: glycoside hydrolase family 19 protein [Patescibacteria group bacterium]|nr:glycoside hydrolase family 19 protein [Patescibacteria group bacterium]
MKSPAEWVEILTSAGVKAETALKWADAFSGQITTTTFSQGAEEIPDFLANILHESGRLEKLEESLNYSAERLCAVWPKRFPTVEDAQPFARNPVALANKVYGGRLGNYESGDGWKYRGRGLLQVTGRDNYIKLGDKMGQDLESNPDLLAQPSYALESAVLWWNGNIPPEVIGDTLAIRKRVNGGTLGLEDVQALTEKLDGSVA